YADPAPDVRAILIGSGRGLRCGSVCFRLLLGGRFDSVIVRVVDPLFPNEAKTRSPVHFRTYTIRDARPCELPGDIPFETLHTAQLWAVTGRCLPEVAPPPVPSRRFEVLVNEEAPDHPRWPAEVTHLRLVDGDSRRDIAHAERASVDLPFWIP